MTDRNEEVRAQLAALKAQIAEIEASLPEPLPIVRVSWFEKGNQGLVLGGHRCRLEAHEETLAYPAPFFCGAQPIVPRTFHWVSLFGQRWPVHKDGDEWKLTAIGDSFSRSQIEEIKSWDIDH